MGKFNHNYNAFKELRTKFSLFLRDQWYSHACKISTDFDEKCKGSESRQVAHRKSHWEAKG